MSLEHRTEVFARISKAYQEGEPWTMGQILDHISAEHEVVLEASIVLHLFKQQIKSRTAAPIEDRRLALDPEAIVQ
jgi:hypothetical protein